MLAAMLQPGTPVTAFPMPTPQPGKTRATGSPSPTPPPHTLPLGTTIAFVLDGTISSASSKRGDLVGAHLKAPLTIDDRVLAPAGTPVQIIIANAVPAENPDIYGFVEIFFRALTLPDGTTIPLRAPSGHLSVDPSAGHQETVGVENTIGDIFLPTALFHVFRKGRNFTLEPGAEIRAVTEATVVARPGGSIAVTTPAPLVMDVATPHATFNGTPLATPNPDFHPQLTAPPLTATSPPTPR